MVISDKQTVEDSERSISCMALPLSGPFRLTAVIRYWLIEFEKYSMSGIPISWEARCLALTLTKGDYEQPPMKCSVVTTQSKSRRGLIIDAVRSLDRPARRRSVLFLLHCSTLSGRHGWGTTSLLAQLREYETHIVPA